MLRSHILLLDHDPRFLRLARRALPEAQYQLVELADAAALRARVLEQPAPHAVLIDVQLTSVDSRALCAEIVAEMPDLPVILVTDERQMQTAVDAIRVGAFDILHEPFTPDTLRIAVERAVAHRTLRHEVRRLRREVAGLPTDAELLGNSEPMQRLLRLLPKIAASTSSVLVTGESGTGKELVARAIHRRSPRKDAPLIAINCAALPETLLEAELFGHTKGAFTDARTARAGLFVRAHRGTLFLDEIGDMPLSVQAKLLRVLQERTVRPVGADDEIAVDVRVIAATHRDLDAAVDAGSFRADLMYRLDVVRLEVPPLRERGDDVLLLAERFLAAHAGAARFRLDAPVQQALRAWPWPGNVRELQNCLERAVMFAEGDLITSDDLPRKIAAAAGPVATVRGGATTALVTLAEVERDHVLRVLEAVQGNRGTAAKILGLDRKTLYRKLLQWGGTP